MSGGSGSSSGPARPLQVTVAGITATTACVLLVVTLIDAMTSVRSIESQDSIRRFLSTPPGSSLGLGVSEVVGILRGLVLFSGALAAAGAVLGAYTLRRHRGARVGLSVVALLMMFTTTFVAGLLPFFVAVAATMLWRKEARDWFDGKEPAPREAPPGPARAIPPAGLAGGPPSANQGANEGAHPGVNQGVSQGANPYAGPGSSAVHAGPDRAALRLTRPPAVTIAVILTWVFSALTALLLLGVAVVLVAAPDSLIDAFQRDPRIAARSLPHDQVLAGVWLVVAGGLFWCLAAIALGVLAFRGVRAGQVGVIVSAVFSALFGYTLVLPLLAGAATVVLLLRPESRRFFAGRPAPPSEQGSGRPPVW